MGALEKIPARYGKAVELKKGQKLKVINDSGSQVVDTWAFNAEDLKECMSMQHTRPCLKRLIPQVGDSLITNKWRPILTVIEDTCGIHDTLVAACNLQRYQVLGVTEYHRSCQDNLYEALQELSLTPPEVPSPLNLWMNVPWQLDPKPAGRIEYVAPRSKPNDYIVFKAEMDLVLAFSSCPQDIIPVNGVPSEDGKFSGDIHDCHYQIL